MSDIVLFWWTTSVWSLWLAQHSAADHRVLALQKNTSSRRAKFLNFWTRLHTRLRSHISSGMIHYTTGGPVAELRSLPFTQPAAEPSRCYAGFTWYCNRRQLNGQIFRCRISEFATGFAKIEIFSGNALKCDTLILSDFHKTLKSIEQSTTSCKQSVSPCFSNAF